MIRNKIDPVEILVLDLIEWLAASPRDYDETMAAWRTSCPRLAVWEEAVERGFVARRANPEGKTHVVPTDAGLLHLSTVRDQRVL